MASATIAPPKTYYEWAAVLDRLKAKEDDDAVLAAMQKGTIQWQAGVAERFAKKLIDAVNWRMNAASDRFRKEMTRCNGQERAIVQARSSRYPGEGSAAVSPLGARTGEQHAVFS